MKLTKKQLNQIKDLYWNQNKTVPEIAKMFNVSYPAIRRWMIKLNIPRRDFSTAQILSNGSDKITKEKLIELYIKQDKTQEEISKILGFSQTGIGNIIKRCGIKSKGKARIGEKNGMFGRTHTPEAIEKIREANTRQFLNPKNRYKHALLTCKQIQEGKTGKAYNKLENLYAEYLKSKDIKFVQQYRVSKYLFDFYIPEENLLIEVNGTFWHADPRVYANKKLYPIQIKNLENDKNKIKKAISLGYKVKVVWEQDVYNKNNKR